VLDLDGAKARIGGHSVALICHDAPLPAVWKPDGIRLKLDSNDGRTNTPALSQSLRAYMTLAYTARQR